MNPGTIRQMKQQLQRIEGEVTRLNSLASHFRGVISFYTNTDENSELRRNPGDVLKDNIQNVLKTEGRAMHPKDILTRLEAEGILVPGENPPHNIRSHMSGDQNKRFYAVGNDTWGLTDWTPRMDLEPHGEGDADERAGPEAGQDTGDNVERTAEPPSCNEEDKPETKDAEASFQCDGLMASQLLEEGEPVKVRFTAPNGARALDYKRLAEVIETCCGEEDVTDVINDGATIKVRGGTATIKFDAASRQPTNPHRIPGRIHFTEDDASPEDSEAETTAATLFLDLQDSDTADLILQHTR